VYPLMRHYRVWWLASPFLMAAVFTLGLMANSAFPAERQVKDIVKKGNVIIISKQFAEAVEKNSDLVLFHITVKSRFDKEGHLDGIQLVQIDRGSAVEKVGGNGPRYCHCH
jgi:hypothetical protein